MATLFLESSAPEIGFESLPLNGTPLGLDIDGQLLEGDDANGAGLAAMLVGDHDASHAASRASWFVMSSPCATILRNGAPLRSTGIAALQDRDELVFHGSHGTRRLFFSDKEVPTPEASPDDLSEDACCPRCQLSLRKPPPGCGTDEVDDKPLIRCPHCLTFYHHDRCWSYSATCIVCGGATLADKLWHPADLD